MAQSHSFLTLRDVDGEEEDADDGVRGGQTPVDFVRPVRADRDVDSSIQVARQVSEMLPHSAGNPSSVAVVRDEDVALAAHDRWRIR